MKGSIFIFASENNYFNPFKTTFGLEIFNDLKYSSI